MDIWSKYTQRYRDEGNKIVWSDFATSAFCADGPKGVGQGKYEGIGFERTKYGPKGEIQGCIA